MNNSFVLALCALAGCSLVSNIVRADLPPSTTTGSTHGNTDSHFFDLLPWGSEKFWILAPGTTMGSSANAIVITLDGPDLSHLMEYSFKLSNDAMETAYMNSAADIQFFTMTLVPSTPDFGPTMEVQLTDYHVLGAGGFEVQSPAGGWTMQLTRTDISPNPAGGTDMTYHGSLTALGLQVNVPGFTSGFQTAIESAPMDFEWVVTVVPEPSTMTLVLLAGAAVLIAKRRSSRCG